MTGHPYRPEPVERGRESAWSRLALLAALSAAPVSAWVLTSVCVASTFNGGYPHVPTVLLYGAGLGFAAMLIFVRDGSPSYFDRTPYRSLLAAAWWPVFLLGLAMLGVGAAAVAFARWLRYGKLEEKI